MNGQTTEAQLAVLDSVANPKPVPEGSLPPACSQLSKDSLSPPGLRPKNSWHEIIVNADLDNAGIL